MIRLNAFVTMRPYFKNFLVYRIPFASKKPYELIRVLLEADVAYAYPFREYLYFKGDHEKTLEKINEISQQNEMKGKFILGQNIEQRKLGPNDNIIIKPIVYQAFEKTLTRKGFRRLGKNIKRMVPQIDIEKLSKRFVKYLTDDVIIIRGIKYMLEIRPSGYGLLWLDIYTPSFHLKNSRYLSPKELKRLGIMDQYRKYALLQSKDRWELLQNILDMICEDKNNLILNFPDGDSIEFFIKPIELEFKNYV